MSEEATPEDPFAEGDPEAAEREARRREREERRRSREGRERSEGNRRSLADRVSGALGGGQGGGGSGEEPRPAPVQPRGVEEQSEHWERELPSASRPVEVPPEIGSRERPMPTPRETGGAGSAHRLLDRVRASQATDEGRVMIRRRLLAGGAALAVLVAFVLLLRTIGGGEQEPTPVAAVKPVETIDVLVPEGLTIEQIAEVAKKAKLKGNYEKAVEQAAKDFPLRRYDAGDAPSMEGFLFPATYELEKGARAGELVAKQLEAFEQNFSGVDLKRARKKNLNDYDVLTIASLIEKEIQVADERRLAAAVIYNRLEAGDTLGIDATLRYELKNYDEQLLQSELDAATPYNSRLTPGLPPTPIANPGLASIEAAADPANSDVLFFVVKPGTCGEHVFTADQDEFDAAEAEYQEALAAEGGSPTECP